MAIEKDGYGALIQIKSVGSKEFDSVLNQFIAVSATEESGYTPAEAAPETKQESAAEPAEEEPAAEEAPAADAAESASAPTETEAPAYQYIAHKKSKMFHVPTCSTVSSIPESSREYLNESRSELINAGYTPCSRCHP